MGKLLIAAGLVLVLAGLIITFKIQIPWIGRLPGDICIKKENFSFYFPITTSLLVSALLSLLFTLGLSRKSSFPRKRESRQSTCRWKKWIPDRDIRE